MSISHIETKCREDFPEFGIPNILTNPDLLFRSNFKIVFTHNLISLKIQYV